MSDRGPEALATGRTKYLSDCVIGGWAAVNDTLSDGGVAVEVDVRTGIAYTRESYEYIAVDELSPWE